MLRIFHSNLYGHYISQKLYKIPGFRHNQIILEWNEVG